MVIKPIYTTSGIPKCSYAACPSYDGKRCRVLGCRPDDVCEPAVATTLAERDAARAEVEQLHAELRLQASAQRRTEAACGEQTRALADASAEVARLKTEMEAMRAVVEAAVVLYDDVGSHFAISRFDAAVGAYRRTRPSGEGER